MEPISVVPDVAASSQNKESMGFSIFGSGQKDSHGSSRGSLSRIAVLSGCSSCAQTGSYHDRSTCTAQA